MKTYSILPMSMDRVKIDILTMYCWVGIWVSSFGKCKLLPFVYLELLAPIAMALAEMDNTFSP